MNAQRREIWQGALLLASLSVFCSVLGKNSWRLHEMSRLQKATVDSNHDISISSLDGFDVFGRKVDSKADPNTAVTVAFFLRGDTLIQDLAFWRSVERDISKVKQIRLEGFCSSTAKCTELIEQSQTTIDFPMIISGETASVQAIVNADFQGKAIVQIHAPKPKTTTVVWRNRGRTPLDVLRELEGQ